MIIIVVVIAVSNHGFSNFWLLAAQSFLTIERRTGIPRTRPEAEQDISIKIVVRFLSQVPDVRCYQPG